MNNSFNLTPIVDIDERLNTPNIFLTEFEGVSAAEWLDILVRSIDSSEIGGVTFPSFPALELQSHLHGHYGEKSLREAYDFYSFIRSLKLTGPDSPWYRNGYLLDFGCGWGRILRMFMLDFPLKNIIGYEPDGRYSSIARAHNPYVSILSGDFLPSGILPRERFDLVVSWSIFSHLSRYSATRWLTELSHVVSKGGYIVITTWGMRFLTRLREEKELLNLGRDIHWYSKLCLEAIGDLDVRFEEYRAGKFVWFSDTNSILYGEAFVSRLALESIIEEFDLSLTISHFDETTLAQDVFVLQVK